MAIKHFKSPHELAEESIKKIKTRKKLRNAMNSLAEIKIQLEDCDKDELSVIARKLLDLPYDKINWIDIGLSVRLGELVKDAYEPDELIYGEIDTALDYVNYDMFLIQEKLENNLFDFTKKELC